MRFHVRLNVRIRWSWLFFQQRNDAHDHAWNAITALKRIFRKKGFLYGVQFVFRGEALDGLDILLLNRQNGCDARRNSAIIYKNRASTTRTLATTVFCPTKMKLLAQHLKQRPIRVSSHRLGLTVQFELDRSVHAKLLSG
jgi:hypothetical protein